MKKLMKIGMICMAVGALIAAGAGAMKGFDFKAVAENSAEEQTFEIADAFDEIEIENASGTIRVEKAQDGVCRAVCTQTDSYRYEVGVKEGALKIRGVRSGVFGIIGFGSGDAGVCLYLPEKTYAEIEIETASGDVTIYEGLTFRDVDMDAASGNLNFRAVCTGILEVDTSSGDVKIGGTANGVKIETASGSVALTADAQNVSVETTSGDVKIESKKIETARISTTSGDVTFDGAQFGSLRVGSTSGSIEFIDSDAQKIEARTVSGDVSGNLLTDKIFNIHTTSGDVEAPRSVGSGGECDIKTTSGDVDITVG